MFKSIESLIATNNGFFKSEKQANFLISQLEKEEGNIQVGSTYGNGFMITYFHDEKGITKKDQYNYKTSKTIVLWERVVDGVLSIQQEKKLKILKRKLNKAKKDLKARLLERNNYDSYKELLSKSFVIEVTKDHCDGLIKLNEDGILNCESDIEYLEIEIKKIK